MAIPLLLARLALKGALVTIDAMGTQVEIARRIIDGGGDYCLALKGNHPLLHAEVERFFADPKAEIVSRHTTTDGDHGRIEERRHAVCHDVAWLFSDRRYADEPRFPGLAMIGMVESVVERAGKTTTERRYDLCSAKLDATTFARAVRAHWGVESRLHWVLDEAEVAARDLLVRYPDEHDGWDRLGMVHAARGENKQAADCYRKVLDIIRRRPGDYDAAFDEKFVNLIAKLDPPAAT